MVKQLDEPFYSYWNNRSTVSTKKAAKNAESEYHQDEHYRMLKKAICEEAIRKWRSSSNHSN